MGLDHEWGSGMSSRVATSQLKEPRGMTFLIPTSGLNPYSSLLPMGNVYPYSIVIVAKQVKEVEGDIGEFFVPVIFPQIGSRMTILFQFQEVEDLASTNEVNVDNTCKAVQQVIWSSKTTIRSCSIR